MKQHLSDSQIGTYLDCGVRWEFRYVKKIIAAPGLAILRGKSGHAAAAKNFRQKIETRVDLPAKELRDFAAADFEKALQGDVDLADDERAKGWKAATGDALDTVVDSVHVFAQQSAPQYQPVEGGVEKGFRIELPGERDFIGFMDLVHEGGIVDFKFRQRKPKPCEAARSFQLTAYAAAFCAEHGRMPDQVGIDTITSTATRTTRELQTAVVTTDDVDRLASVINQVQRGIDAGVFLPAKPDWWGCSTKYCGYARMCPYFKGDE